MLLVLGDLADGGRKAGPRSREHGHEYVARRFEEQAQDKRQQAVLIRQVLTEGAADAV